MKGQSDKKGQQEMMGFVLIVVLVIVALMIFLVFQMRKPVEIVNNNNLVNLLSTLGEHTTGCAVTGETYLNVNDLLKACYKNRECSNLGVMSCDYVKTELDNLLTSVYASESIYSGYRFNVTVVDKTGAGLDRIYDKSIGNCTGVSESGMEKIALDSTQTAYLNIVLKFCK